VQIGLLEPDQFSPGARATLARLGEVCEWTGGDLASFLAPLDALFVRLAHRIDRRLLELAPRLRWVCSPTTGHLHIDEEALASRGVKVLSLRGERAFLETIRATPEHTFGLILALLRRYRPAIIDTHTGRWNRDAFRGEELFGNHVGIIGMGRVGWHVASYCAAFGAHVRWYDPAVPVASSSWARMDDIPALIDASRVVVVCASFEAGQPPILRQPEIERLTGRYLVNTARGELVDESALFDALRHDRLAGVATDVIADENGRHCLAAWCAIAEGRNVILTPHIGGATTEAMARTEQFVAEKLAEEIIREQVSA
jgi:D-3-phosphoglycerate dehydrogenase